MKPVIFNSLEIFMISPYHPSPLISLNGWRIKEVAEGNLGEA